MILLKQVVSILRLMLDQVVPKSSSSEIMEHVNVENDLIRKETSLGATPNSTEPWLTKSQSRHRKGILNQEISSPMMLNHICFFLTRFKINQQSSSQKRSSVWVDPSLPSQAIHIMRKRPQTFGVMQQGHEVFILLGLNTRMR